MPLTPELRASVAVGHRRALLASAALALGGAISIALIGGGFRLIWLMNDLIHGIVRSQSVYEASDHYMARLGSVQGFVWLASFVLFLRWLHRALAASALLNPEIIVPTPGQGVLGFFIPLVNLVAPVQTVSVLHRALEPARLPLPVTVVDDPAAGYRDLARREIVTPWRRIEAPVALWWGCWLVASFGGYLLQLWTSPGESQTPAGLRSGAIAFTVFEAVRLAQAVLGVLVVRGIDRRTAEFARRRDALPAA